MKVSASFYSLLFSFVQACFFWVYCAFSLVISVYSCATTHASLHVMRVLSHPPSHSSMLPRIPHTCTHTHTHTLDAFLLLHRNTHMRSRTIHAHALTRDFPPQIGISWHSYIYTLAHTYLHTNSIHSRNCDQMLCAVRLLFSLFCSVLLELMKAYRERYKLKPLVRLRLAFLSHIYNCTTLCMPVLLLPAPCRAFLPHPRFHAVFNFPFHSFFSSHFLDFCSPMFLMRVLFTSVHFSSYSHVHISFSFFFSPSQQICRRLS